MAHVQNIKPRFEVERLDGTRIEKRVRRNMATGMNEVYDAEVPAGYMVYFPSGNSMRVADDAELRRLGFDKAPNLIDMESGEEVGEADMSLKRHVQRRQGASRRADTGGVDAEQGG